MTIPRSIPQNIPSVLITIPVYHAIEPQPMMSFLLFAGHVARARQYRARWCVGGPKLPVCQVRNQAIEFALSQNFSHVLFVDEDMLVPRDLLDRLLVHDKPILTPLFYRATEPHDPLIFHAAARGGISGDVLGPSIPFKEWELYTAPDQPLLECPGGAGTGVMLIRRDVLQAMGDRPFRYPEAGGGADLYFCRRARELGFQTFCDPSITVPQMSPGAPYPPLQAGSQTPAPAPRVRGDR